MQDPQYLEKHESKPDIDDKTIDLNDLEEGVKLSILSDIERDQRLNYVKQKIEEDHRQNGEIEKKRKADHLAFNSFVKCANEEKSELQGKYNELFTRHTALQSKYINLKNAHTDLQIAADTATYLNTSLQTSVATRLQCACQHY